MKDFYRQKEWEQESYTTQKTELVIASLVFPDGLGIKNLPANAGDVSLIPGWGKSSGEGNGNPLQCSYLGNPMDQGAWGDTVHGVTRELDTTQQLNNNHKLQGYFP